MSETEEKIVYPKLLDDYFKSNEVIIKQIPDKFRVLKQDALPDKTIKSTRIFVNYLNKELAFWSYEELRNNPIVSSYKSYYSQALTNVNNAMANAIENPNQAIYYLKNAIDVVTQNCQIGSITELAKMFKFFKDKPNHFFYGFQNAITPNTQVSYYNYAAWHEGFYYGMEYKLAISSIEKFVQNYNMTYAEATKEAEKEIANLLAKSNTLFHDQELRVEELWANNKKELEQQKADTNSFIEEKQLKMVDLEKTYEEKLKLSKPAEYWKKMSKSYTRSGGIWLGVSTLLAIAIIAGIALLIIFTPNLFEKNAYWLDLVKDTALLTVITSVAIYVLRITIKLSLSSFHLSRDAREREQLSYFYLSLMESKGITEKERALIINSLFSRSDTGLLKGDSAPSMTANITDLLEKDKSK